MKGKISRIISLFAVDNKINLLYNKDSQGMAGGFMFNLVFNFLAGAGVLVFAATEQAKIRSKAIKKDLFLFSVFAAVAWLVDSGLLIRAILAR